jgi:hypothetical protein
LGQESFRGQGTVTSLDDRIGCIIGKEEECRKCRNNSVCSTQATDDC